MKLRKLKSLIDGAVDRAGNTDPDVEIWLDEVEYFISRMGQFGFMPDVTINIEKVEE